MPRYVILKHDWNGEHFDLMLEEDNALATWRMTLSLQSGGQAVEELPAHRLEYLTYEGPVSGNRGIVKRIASGDFVIQRKTRDSLHVQLSGDHEGYMTLHRLEGVNWRLEWKPD